MKVESIVLYYHPRPPAENRHLYSEVPLPGCDGRVSVRAEAGTLDDARPLPGETVLNSVGPTLPVESGVQRAP